MPKPTRHITLVSVCLLIAHGPLSAAGLGSATRAAQGWLACIDSKQYEDCWEKASAFLREHVSLDEWIASASAARGRLTQMRERNLQAVEFANTLPGAPPGQYAIVRFHTTDAQGHAFMETVTVMRTGQEWKAAGYFIKPTTEIPPVDSPSK